MNKMLFHEVNDTLIAELRDQLSDTARLMDQNHEDMTSIYKEVSYKMNVTPRDIAIMRQIRDLQKRYIGKSKDGNRCNDRDLVCWKKFLAANECAKKQNLNFPKLDQGTMHILELARQNIAKIFWRLTESDRFPFVWTESNNSVVRDLLFPIEGFDMGPGTVQGIGGVSVLEKLVLEDWTTSSNTASSYLQVIRKMWRACDHMGTTPKLFPVSSLLKPSFVPKDTDTSRLILSQNNGDLLLQYPAANLLSSILEYYGIDLAVQQAVNRRLARKGSLYDNLDLYEYSLHRRTIRPCTIDLSSASDIVGIELVKFLCPPPLFNYMDMSRAKAVEYGDEKVTLNMFATMGNAYCFPLQTLVFVSIVDAIYTLNGQPTTVDGVRTYSVFGDDIIVDVSVYDCVIKTLKILEMIPNPKKSFSYGFFRESCGTDFFCGYDVRPVFCEKLQDDCAVYSLANQLLDWGARHCVIVSKTVNLLLRNVGVKTIVPMDSNVSDGLRVPEVSLCWLPKDWVANYKVSLCLDNKNSYVNHTYVVRRRETVPGYVRLHGDVQCALTFLKGGVKQRDNSGTFYSVNTQKTRIVSEVVMRSLWDIPIQDESGLFTPANYKASSSYGSLCFMLACCFGVVAA